jgi:serine/threonine protein kinase
MRGITTALHELHKRFNCRHGDLKPSNILCFTEGGETVLKIADFGISRIHHDQTIARNSATATLSLTHSYQGPEVEFEKLSKDDQRPRSRKYDIWSLGCIFLEFSIWLLHGPKAIEGFAAARGRRTSSTDSLVPLYSYKVTDRAAKDASVHQLVSWTIQSLQEDQRCKGETALGALLALVKEQMLQPDVDRRPWAEDVGKKLDSIVQEAETRPKYLFHSCEGTQIPPLDFGKFQLV